MMEIYSVLSRGFVKLSKNLLAFTTHWVANTNKTKYQTFIYLFEKKYTQPSHSEIFTNRNFLAQKYQNNKPLNIINSIFQAKWYKIFLSIFEKLNYNHFFKNIINYCLYTTKIF